MGVNALQGKAICPASCGEIIEGTIDNTNILVTCPIAIYTEVLVKLNNEKNKYTCDSNLECNKTIQAVRKTLKYFNAVDLGADIKVKSNIPCGIGLSSSTADITAACFATAQALGESISPDIVADIALSIEPSDGIMYPGITLFDHIEGKIRKRLGFLPKMDVYIIDTGEKVDTEQFNNMKELREKNRQKEPAIKEALSIVFSAFQKKDLRLLGQAMKISALAHQSILPKPHLPDIIDLGEKYNAIGINIAHSGSAIGMFFEKDYDINQNLWKELDAIMHNYSITYRITKTCTCGGGPKTIQIYSNKNIFQAKEKAEG